MICEGLVKSPVIVALDYDTPQKALAMADRLDPQLCRVKVGKELFTSAGPQVVEKLQSKGFDVFLDLKFHDIPNTTSKAVAAAAQLGVWMVNVHASGGRRMMEACRNILDQHGSDRSPLLIAVTVLTSMEQTDLEELGLPRSDQLVMKLASLARESGMDGVVCSAQESKMLKQALGSSFSLVTPGIRPAEAASDDQRRIVTPAQAMANGSDYLVIGRPITQAADPIVALQNIITTLQS
ncbi:orotidine-5'-phosphate decarboxylase [Sansalvadorimonas sp. 2012CJ34-2]|uniref:Orotidine 5'-phosphate decarboxylase n=1 Tax=Parendozoicomonas callyspongiae TaxID=2942213 RepID=A0ABT0PJ02_9GAMM|nr:orotidine-5'-phosphate decarboxylase [Sansalvadorimonas sp. 2012CJ34-2]MCL6271338.1 orotidine-5'-phosphate decarboxylase [Sansalvadorimonas sp. 2012CJ34-2]